jgi:hypothetical protein
MTIHIPKPLVVFGAIAGALLGAYIIKEEVPAMYRYVFKFEAM